MGLGAASVHSQHLSPPFAEHGLLGLLVLPGLLFAISRGVRNRHRPTVLLSVAFIASWGIFSHNVLEELHLLLAVSLAAALAGEIDPTPLADADDLRIHGVPMSPRLAQGTVSSGNLWTASNVASRGDRKWN